MLIKIMIWLKNKLIINSLLENKIIIKLIISFSNKNIKNLIRQDILKLNIEKIIAHLNKIRGTR